MSEVDNVTQETSAKSDRSSDSTRGVRLYRPLTDIVETEDGVELLVEMPGVSVGDVELELERRVLTIKGHAQITNPEEFSLGYSEYGEGDYERSFTLSEDLDGTGVQAEIKNGVLSVKLPRAQQARPQRIAVKAA